jgi:hypothetical protein
VTVLAGILAATSDQATTTAFYILSDLSFTNYHAIRRLEVGSNTSTVTLRVVGGYGKGIQCLGVHLGHFVPGGYNYRDLALQVGGLDARLTNLLCKNISVAKSKDVKTRMQCGRIF